MTPDASRRPAPPPVAELALLALGVAGLVRLALAIAHFAVTWASSLEASADPLGARATLELWRAITTRGLQLADLATTLTLLLLARLPGRRLDRALATTAAVAYAVSAFGAAQPPGALPLPLGLFAAAAPLLLGLWLLRDALRLRRPGLATAATALALGAALALALPIAAGALSGSAPLLTVVRLTSAWSLLRPILFGLTAALPLVLALRHRQARLPADPVRPLPDPRWASAALAVGGLRQALVAKALVVALTLAWAMIVGGSPALPGPGMLSATGAALAVASLWSLASARRWLASPARGPATWALTAALALCAAAELGVAWSGAHGASAAEVEHGLEALGASLTAALGANAAAALLLVLALHRLARGLGVARPARTLGRVGLLGTLALLIPWSAWMGRGLDALLDPWALGAVLAAVVGLAAALTVLALAMDDLERRIRRGREAAGVAARFT